MRQATDGGQVFESPAGGAMILRGCYPSFEGAIANGPHLRIGLCVGNTATLAQQVDGAKLEGLWQTGSVVVTPSGAVGISRCSPVDMIGLAVLPSLLRTDQGIGLPDLEGASGRFTDDPLLAAVMTALHREAEVHGVSTAFFEHGIALVLRRFGELSTYAPSVSEKRPLSISRLERVRGYVESRLADDISVAEMAAVAGMDPTGFTRALRARTGLPPYAWLTQRRMERACECLVEDWSVTRVAHALGYANSSKFSAAFRRVTGLSPSEWRKHRSR